MAETMPPPLQVQELPGRGRALVAARPIKAGEVILTEAPLLIYPASFSSLPYFCSHCFLSLQSTNSFPCPNCQLANFCSHRCLSSSHPHLLCHFLKHNPNKIDLPSSVEDHLLFLLSAYSLPQDSILRLLSLSSPTTPRKEEVELVHSIITHLVQPNNFTIESTASLLAKDKTNAFAIMEPFRHGIPQGSRKVRAYAVYPNAALFNHDCLPNACHFDYVDRPGERNTEMVVRALHGVSEGREVCLSYFAVNWSYAERQKRLLEDYGFRCECDRCKVESRWKQEEEEEVGGNGDGNGDGMGEEEEQEEEECDDGMEQESDGDGDGDEDFPHAYFFVKYLCDHEGCGGTLAPLPPSVDGKPSDMLECNVCGQLKKDEDGIAEDAGDDGVAMLEQ